jgi:hypothetical protein
VIDDSQVVDTIVVVVDAAGVVDDIHDSTSADDTNHCLQLTMIVGT